MALKAGRVGVRKDQVDVHGIVKKDSYTLPTASSTVLGGVKAVPKTEEMTKEVGIGSDGKLYVEPSSGGGVEVGSATLESGVSGYLNYITFDNLCYVFGQLNLSNYLPGFSSIDCTGNLPCELDFDFMVTNVSTGDVYQASSSPNTYMIALMYDNTAKKFKLCNRGSGSAGSGHLFNITGLFIYKNATRTELTINGCLETSKLYKITDGVYTSLCSDVKNPLGLISIPATSSSDSTTKICDYSEDYEYILSEYWFQNKVYGFNASRLKINNANDELDIYYIRTSASSGYGEIVGATLYKIKEEE